MGKKRLTAEELNIPATSTLVPKGYPVSLDPTPSPWLFCCTVFGPIISSPRPRVTSRGTFMPSDYRKHCQAIGASLAFARGLWEAERGTRLVTSTPLHLDLAFWSVSLRGDLDNLAKTIMDAGQLKKNEPDGAQLWDNDRQVHGLSVDWIPTEDEQWEQTVIRIRRK